LKMGRRNQHESSDPGDWDRLLEVVKRSEKASDILKYECLEEALCFLSALDLKENPGTPQAFEIIKILSKYNTQDYGRGNNSIASNNFLRNIETIKQYKNEFRVFSFSGSEIQYYCKRISDGFPVANIQLVEEIGAACWARVQRVMELREYMHGIVEAVALGQAHSSSETVFHDSGIGSSIGTEAQQKNLAESQKVQRARSIISFPSLMSNEAGNNEGPPIPEKSLDGKRTCTICHGILTKVDSASEWK
jgi:hypothetical protein